VSITLSAAQLREVLDFINPDGEQDAAQMEDEVSIEYFEARTSDDGEFIPAGYFAWVTEYPEEGSIGPLGMPNDEVIRLQQEAAANLPESA
jgi:hypothetical protein